MRPILRPYVALLLLLCLGRTLLPEAWVLALHRHTHSTEQLAARRPSGKELVSPRHTHCHAEQFYDVPFAGAAPVRLPQPRIRAFYQLLVVPTPLAKLVVALPLAALRGPPRT